MSAWMVGEAHIDALLTAALHFCPEPTPLRWRYPLEPGHRVLTPRSASRVGAVLLDANQRSVNYLNNTSEWEPAYLYKPVPGQPDMVITIKALNCLRYQSCEHPQWTASEAQIFLDALAQALDARRPGSRKVTDLPGYGDLPGWPVTSRDVFVPPDTSAVG